LNVEEVLAKGEIEVLGRLPYSSNFALLTRLKVGRDEVVAVHKPQRGERPLWDFPSGTLAAREVAAYLVSEAAGWDLVPPSVHRKDGPAGPGSFQLFIEHDPERHFFILVHDLEDRLPFQHFCAFDIVINNADRKGGHIVEDVGGRLWGVDHGLSFNVEPKLRTVIWGFAGDELAPEVRAALSWLETALEPGGSLEARLLELLSEPEVGETRARLQYLLRAGRFPQPEGPYVTPWPLV
jgi:hypothetical protein